MDEAGVIGTPGKGEGMAEREPLRHPGEVARNGSLSLGGGTWAGSSARRGCGSRRTSRRVRRECGGRGFTALLPSANSKAEDASPYLSSLFQIRGSSLLRSARLHRGPHIRCASPCPRPRVHSHLPWPTTPLVAPPEGLQPALKAARRSRGGCGGAHQEPGGGRPLGARRLAPSHPPHLHESVGGARYPGPLYLDGGSLTTSAVVLALASHPRPFD